MLKNGLLKLNFQDEGHLYANWMFYILTIYCKSFLFQSLGCGLRMHIPILTEVQNGRILCQKKVVFWWTKVSFWCLFSEIKGTCMAIAYFIFWVFTVNIFFCSSWFVAYIYTFSSKQSSKMDGENAIKSSLILLKNVVFESYLPRWRPHACEILALYFDSLLYVSFFSVLPL